MGFIDIKKLNTYKKKAFFILSELDKTAVVTCDVHIRTKYETPTDGYANMSGC
jgi:hypothetical protein